MTRLGRALGPGTLRKVTRGKGPGQWVLTYRASDGSRRREALSSDKAVAERRRMELIRQRDLEVAGLGGVEGQSRSLPELRDMYLDDLSHRATPMHLVNVRQKLDRVLSRVSARRVRDLKPYDLMKLRNDLLASGLSVRTANLHGDVTRSMLAWALSAGLIAENPLAAMKRLREDETTVKRRRRALSDVEIDRFVQAARDDDAETAERASVTSSESTSALWALRSRGLRVPQAALWMTLIESAARYREVTTMTWADIDLPGRTITVRAINAKARRQRTIPIGDELTSALAALRVFHVQVRERAVEPADRVFLSPEGASWGWSTVNLMRIFDRLLKRAGIVREDATGARLDIHSMRGTRASQLARRGVPLSMTQRILGHSTVEMTAKHYTFVSIEDLRAAIERTA